VTAAIHLFSVEALIPRGASPSPTLLDDTALVDAALLGVLLRDVFLLEEVSLASVAGG